MVKGSCAYNGESFSQLHHPTKFGVDKHFVSGDIMVLVCQVISQYHVITRSSVFIGENPSWKVTILPNLVAINTAVVEI